MAILTLGRGSRPDFSASALFYNLLHPSKLNESRVAIAAIVYGGNLVSPGAHGLANTPES